MNLEYDDFELFLEHVSGAWVIDMEGTIVYMNNQCAQYLEVDRNDSIGKKAIEVFPYTKMIEGLKKDKAEIVFYNSNVGIGISVLVPIYKENQKVGLLEYDIIQNSEFLYDFVDEYRLFLDKEFKLLTRDIKLLKETKYTINNILGKSKVMMELREQVVQASHSNSTVLITGDTGTGKELVVHGIHNLSNRRDKTFVRINAATLPESLAESELFGYEEGSFTGAVKKGKKGKFEQADGGTIFIDEINQMPLNLQPKLLRVLQEKEIDRIGGTSSIPVDVRILVATNKDLKKLVEEGKFREDLFYRLNVFEIHTPSLRERMEDIPALTEGIVKELNIIMGKRISKINPIVFDMLKDYDWPGNVRELHNVIERAMNYADEEVLLPEHFEFKKVIYEKIEGNSKNLSRITGKENRQIFESENPVETLKNIAEREFLIGVITECDYNISKASKRLKIARSLLYQKMKRLGISL